MKIKTLEKENKNVRFLLEGVNHAFANSLRRTIMSGVPTLAIEDVRFKNNTSGLFDEVLAHRLGLVPWEFDPEDLNLREECSCEGEGCENCTVNFKLEMSGEGSVKAKHIEAPQGVKPKNPELLLIELVEDQEVSVTAEGRLGKGKEHAKWQAANTAYKNYPEVKVSGDVEEAEKIAERCPGDVFKLEDGELKVENPESCVSCYVCEKLDDNIEVKHHEDKFIFKVESISGREPEDIVNSAVESLNQKVEEFNKSLKESL